MKKDKLEVPCEIYSRIVGYYRPVENWNKGKKKEFQERKPHLINKKSTEEPGE